MQGHTVYSHMLLPTSFRGVEADYWHLRSAVQAWDVGCERQVELVGPDAARADCVPFYRERDGRRVPVRRPSQMGS